MLCWFGGAHLIAGVSHPKIENYQRIKVVKNIPTAEDYFQSGKELFDFAWDVVAKLLTTLDEAEYYEIDPEEISESYWKSATRHVTTALSITQQGVEIALKGKIAEISPYILISDVPQRWPSPYGRDSIDFSEFRTLDAQDLIRVHDTFSQTPLPSLFVVKFNELREKRNKFMHSVDKNIVVHVAEVVESLLFMHKTLFPNETWPSVRLEFLKNAPDVELGSDEYATNRVCWEISLAISLLKPSQVKEFFNIDRKQRMYTCPSCLDDANTDAGFEYKLAQLKPKGADSTDLYCPICNNTFPVTREHCEDEECPGNVISEDGACLTCSG
ncbi:hypothetical protein L4D08_00350 [Photobacterium chitinilyticum]|uniref:hypothetical protein n=1 Tax=Photobacterium chitinilyticum TaxID=2485123 RepID=UPI003D133292